MINELNKRILEQSAIKNNAKREIEKIKQEIIALAPKKVGDIINADYLIGDTGRVTYNKSNNLTEPLKVKEIIALTIDGGKSWRWGYLLGYANHKYSFYVSTPKEKGKKRKCNNRREVFFDEDFCPADILK